MTVSSVEGNSTKQGASSDESSPLVSEYPSQPIPVMVPGPSSEPLQGRVTVAEGNHPQSVAYSPNLSVSPPSHSSPKLRNRASHLKSRAVICESYPSMNRDAVFFKRT